MLVVLVVYWLVVQHFGGPRACTGCFVLVTELVTVLLAYRSDCVLLACYFACSCVAGLWSSLLLCYWFVIRLVIVLLVFVRLDSVPLAGYAVSL